MQSVHVYEVEKNALARSDFPIFAMIKLDIAVENSAAYLYVAIDAVLVRICYYRDAARFVERMRSGF